MLTTFLHNLILINPCRDEPIFIFFENTVDSDQNPHCFPLVWKYMLKTERVKLWTSAGLEFEFYVPVNSYDHVETVSSSN